MPLLLQRSYKPDGWLGIILGAKLFFDFSGKYNFETKMEDLFRELGDKGKEGLIKAEEVLVNIIYILNIEPVFKRTIWGRGVSFF